MENKFYTKQFAKLALSFISLILTLLLSVTVTFAWISDSNKILDVQFSTANVDMQVSFYEVVDFDRDGVPDLILGENQQYYEKLNDITDKKKIIISDMLPSQMLTYKIIISNIGDVNCDIAISWSGLSGDFKNVLSVKAWSEVNSSFSRIDGEKKYLAGKDNLDIIDKIPISANAANDTSEIYFQLKFETLKSLHSQGILLNQTDLNNFKNASFALSNIKVTIKLT